MSQRLGMADGRCFTINTSSRLINDYVMNQNSILLEDNYSYRQLLQREGPNLIHKIEKLQNQTNKKAPANGRCNTCDKPLLVVKNTQ